MEIPRFRFRSLLRVIVVVLFVTPVALAQPTSDFTAAIVVDPATGQILYEKNPYEPRPAASMTKMMTLLIVLENIEQGRLSWDTEVVVSAKASKMGGSQVYLKDGEVFSVRELVAATMVHSANDAAMALAEATAGDEATFVRMMNQRARELGLKNTSFHSPHGLPARGNEQDDIMSPRDLAVLGWELMKHEPIRKLAVTQTMPFRDGTFTMYNPNHLIRDYPLATGIKTGYHLKAGFCITASARKGNMDLVAVVMGSRSKKESTRAAERLLEDAFSHFERIEPVQAGRSLPETIRILEGEDKNVPVVSARSVAITVPKGKRPDIEVSVSSTSQVAPIEKGQQVGWIIVRKDGNPVAKIPALAARAVGRASWLSRTWSKIWPFD